MSNSDLTKAIRYNDIPAVRKLVAEGADVNEVDSSGDHPLMTAARRDFIEIMRLLVNHGANIDASAWRGRTVTDWAQENHRPLVIEFLKKTSHELAVRRQQVLKAKAQKFKLKTGMTP